MLVLDIEQARLCIRSGLRRLNCSASRTKSAVTPQEHRMRGTARRAFKSDETTVRRAATKQLTNRNACCPRNIIRQSRGQSSKHSVNMIR
jgi:hypothetical protein